ncbi:hypothetical protein [Streptomyces sp. NPDC056069]|uniref:hypothetical protein n=1 Tax=Streptomyces sp. NPDC056069 TaxID=3345702 RepID=UPI0035DD376E
MADLTYTQLVAAATSLRDALARDAEGIAIRAQKMDEIAQDTARVADTISSLAVDQATVGETREVATILRGIGNSAHSYAAAGNTTARVAGAVADQARTTHAGIQEQYRAAPVSLRGVNRTWLQQE